MKNLFILIGILFSLSIVFSCSKDNEEEDLPPTDAELLVQYGPWLFSDYELINVIDSTNTGISLTQEEIENLVHENYSGTLMSFEANGVGKIVADDGETINTKWKITNENYLEIEWIDPEYTFLLKKIEVSASQFSYESEHISYVDLIGNYIVHYGKFILN